MKFAEAVVTSNRLNDYILDGIVTGTREQNTTVNLSRYWPVFCHDVKQLLMPSE